MGKVLKYKLAESTVVEPLVNSWLAWSHVISPAPASLHLLNYQIPTLESYLKNPEFHIKAAHYPGFAGGPFSDIAIERKDEVERFLADTKRKMAANLEFASSITSFHNRLVNEAKGQSMEPWYQQIPEELRGYCELVYDYHHNPNLRFIEGLLYQSRYYDKSLQSLRLSGIHRDDSRAFFMSTPRLLEKGQIEWRISFDDERLDELYKLDREPQSFGYISDLLQLGPTAESILRALLIATDEPGAVADRWRESPIRIRYCGHACILIESAEISIITDPYIPITPIESGEPRITYRDLPEKIDYALITHNHQDHFSLETLLRLRNRIECLIVPKSYGILYGDISLKLMAQKLKFKNVIELDEMESVLFPGGEIIGAPFLGEHGDLAHGKTAYVARIGSDQILFAADSDCLDKRIYEHLRRALGPIETVFLGTECVGAPLTWHCGPLFPSKPTREQDQTRRYHGCNSKSALEILEAVGARRIYNYAMGAEPWLEHLLGLGLSADSMQLRESNRLLARARGRGFLAADRPFGAKEIFLERGSSGPHVSAPSAVNGAERRRSETVSAENDLENFNGAHSYWENLLGGVRPTLEPVIRSHGSAPSRASQTCWSYTRFTASEQITFSLKELSRKRHFSLFSVLLSAFQTLLWRSTGQDDVIVGTALTDDDGISANGDNRMRRLILRTDLSGDPTFTQLVKRNKEVIARSLEQKDLPIQSLTDLLQKDDQSEITPIFQVMFILDCKSIESLETMSWEESEYNKIAGEAGCGMIFQMAQEENSLSSVAAYNTSLIDSKTVITLVKQFETILDNVMPYLDSPLSKTPFVYKNLEGRGPLQ